MFADGDVLITDANDDGQTALLCAAHGGSHSLPTLKWLLKEGGARITERGHEGNTALLMATLNGNFTTCQWLLEHGGADIAEAADNGQTVWMMLASSMHLKTWFPNFDYNEGEVTEMTALLRHGGAGCSSDRLRG
jgi:ankyrin repeat protein